jgi:hypothetical protein
VNILAASGFIAVAFASRVRDWRVVFSDFVDWLNKVLGLQAHAAEALSSNPTIAQFVPFMVLVIYIVVICFFAYAAWASIFASDKSSQETARGWVKDVLAFFVGVVLGKVL